MERNTYDNLFFKRINININILNGCIRMNVYKYDTPTITIGVSFLSNDIHTAFNIRSGAVRLENFVVGMIGAGFFFFFFALF